MAIPTTSPPRRGRVALLRLLSALLLARTVAAGAASEFDDGTSPKFPGCDNTLQKVKVMYWVNGDEQNSLTGVSARYGAVLPDTAPSDSHKDPAVVPDPKGSCAKSAKPLAGSVAVAERGECTFIEKAKTAEAGGAAALLIVNNEDGPSRRATMHIGVSSRHSPS
jgi:signal peptide peptidase-like protein 2B